MQERGRASLEGAREQPRSSSGALLARELFLRDFSLLGLWSFCCCSCWVVFVGFGWSLGNRDLGIVVVVVNCREFSGGFVGLLDFW